ncbi:MAG: sigma-70 family RNA polymerase sigma factor [Lachnospiraceae bacterium]|nr:sigma-70 family RNA polymerase sigma factor [Lachnospiraceae bacterium]
MDEFDRVYAEYFSEVYKFVISLCQNPELAEEITQETFFKALKNIDKFKGNCKLSTWLCKIAKNTYYSYVKKHNGEIDYFPEIVISEENIEKQFVDKETAYVIHKVLHKLHEPYKEVFWLRIFGELSFIQIGALFDKTESWARVTYYRAKIMIKEELQ